MSERWTEDQMLRLAAKGVAKVDLMGPRGTTLCTMDEIEAMALVLAALGVGPKLLSNTPSKELPNDRL